MITIERRHFATIDNALAQILNELVVTSVRRSVGLISQNTPLSRKLRELIEASGDQVQIPMQLHRHLPRGNRVFAVTMLSESIEFDDHPVSPTPPRGGLPAYTLPELHLPDHGMTQMITSLVQGFLLDQIWHRMYQSREQYDQAPQTVLPNLLTQLVFTTGEHGGNRDPLLRLLCCLLFKPVFISITFVTGAFSQIMWETKCQRDA